MYNYVILRCYHRPNSSSLHELIQNNVTNQHSECPHCCEICCPRKPTQRAWSVPLGQVKRHGKQANKAIAYHTSNEGFPFHRESAF